MDSIGVLLWTLSKLKKNCNVLLLATKDVIIKWWVEHTKLNIDQSCYHIRVFIMTQQMHLDANTTLCQVNIGST